MGRGQMEGDKLRDGGIREGGGKEDGINEIPREHGDWWR